MSMLFQKATKQSARLRMSLIGVAGSGKTYTALNIAKHLGNRIAVIDTERGSASKYSDVFEFDVLELEVFSPAMYVEAIQAAEEAGYEVLIIDSLSHAWTGKGGALEMVDKTAKRSQSGNTFGAWRDVTPQHNMMVDAIINAPGKVFTSIGTGFQKIGQGFDKVGQVILHPLETLKGLDPVKSAEWIANGIRNGGNALANGIVFAAKNPREAAIIAGAVGRGGKAAEDILLELDIVR